MLQENAALLMLRSFVFCNWNKNEWVWVAMQRKGWSTERGRGVGLDVDTTDGQPEKGET